MTVTVSLTEEKVMKNAETYFSRGESYGFMTPKLMEFLGSDFVSAPASSMTSMHNAFEGGLIDHLLRVTKYAVTLNDSLPEAMRVDKVSLVKVCCLHQIGKAKLYTPCTSDWHRENQGKMYDFNEDLTSMRVGERSLYYATKYGVELSEEEAQAILNYEKDDSDKQAKWHTNTIGELLKMAVNMAIMEEKHRVAVMEKTA